MGMLIDYCTAFMATEINVKCENGGRAGYVWFLMLGIIRKTPNISPRSVIQTSSGCDDNPPTEESIQATTESPWLYTYTKTLYAHQN
jgi:hypothetical protein